MNSVTTTIPIHRAEVTAWDDGSILVLLNGVPVTDVTAEAMAVALGWGALAGVPCRIVTEIPAQEVADRAAAAVEQARLHEENERAIAKAAAIVAAAVAAEAVAREAADASRRASDLRGYIADRDAWIADGPGRDEAGYLALLVTP